MSIKVYMSENAMQILKQKIVAQNNKIKEIQKEKSIAYTASGDGWHDNPGYNQLIQLEERAITELKTMEKRLSDSIIWPSKERNTEKVQIGSIVRYKLTNIKLNKIQEHTFEIVGSGESNFRDKLISYDSPIGNAIWEMPIGYKTEINLPIGLCKIEIIELYKDWIEVQK